MPSANTRTLAAPDDQGFAAALHARFAASLDAAGPFEPTPRLALAVSGGGDSLALLILANSWARISGGQLTILTVDHRLRPEAAEETVAVANLARRLGHEAFILTWDETPKPATGLAAAARHARYRLLSTWCRCHAVLHLLVAHTADDQAETLLMRLERGSGLAGLSGMAPVSTAVSGFDGVRLLRPLLGERRADLARLVHAAGLTAVDDPSNHDQARLRPRLRQRIAAFGLDVPRLAKTAAALGREAAVIERVIAELAVQAVTITPFGDAVINRRILAAAEPVVVEKLVARVLAVIGGGDYQPRQDRLARLVRRLTAQGSVLAALTLGGCRLWSRAKAPDLVLITREAAAIGPPLDLATGQSGLWDGRFLIVSTNQPLTISPVGAHATAADFAWDRGDWLAARRMVLPAAFRGSECLGVLRPGKGGLAEVEFRPRTALCAKRADVAPKSGHATKKTP